MMKQYFLDITPAIHGPNGVRTELGTIRYRLGADLVGVIEGLNNVLLPMASNGGTSRVEFQTRISSADTPQPFTTHRSGRTVS